MSLYQKISAILCFLLLFSFSIDAQRSKEKESETRSNGVGLVGGWGSPYGFGFEYSRIFQKHFDFNVGAGIGGSGFRVGGGVRVFNGNWQASPFAGIAIFHNSGFDDLMVNTDGDIGVFNVRPDQAIALRGGLRLGYPYIVFYITGGWAIPFRYSEALIIDGNPSQALIDATNLTTSPGGLELSLGINYQF